jgi:hypothetical protein
MKLTTLLLVVTAAAFSTAGEVYADAIFLNDGRFVSTDIDGYQGLPEPPAQYHFHETSVPSLSYSDFDASISPPLCPCVSKSSQNSQLSGLNFASSLATSGSFGGGFWIISFQMKSVFDIVFELTSFYQFQTSAQSTRRDAYGIYSLTGPSGDVFRYSVPSSLCGGLSCFPDYFETGGLLAPGTYHLYGESSISGGVYKFETLRGTTSLDFSMSLTPVPEGEFPLWLLAFPLSILLLWSGVKDRSVARMIRSDPRA